MPDIGFMNGTFLPLHETVVGVEDRGYQFGDGVYEVVRSYGGVAFQLEAHLARLEHSAEAIRLPVPIGRSELAGYVAEGMRLAGYHDCKVYLQVTRGVASRDHPFPSHTTPTMVLTFKEMKGFEGPMVQQGVGVVIVSDNRWGRCDIKSLNLLPNVLARQQAKEQGAFEAVFVRDGIMTEGAVSNVMAVSKGVLVTHPRGPQILAGVTRQVVLDLAHKEGIPREERPLAFGEFQEAEEVFLTSTTAEILPVVRVDQKDRIPDYPGPVTTLLIDKFRKAVG